MLGNGLFSYRLVKIDIWPRADSEAEIGAVPAPACMKSSRRGSSFLAGTAVELAVRYMLFPSHQWNASSFPHRKIQSNVRRCVHLPGKQSCSTATQKSLLSTKTDQLVLSRSTGDLQAPVVFDPAKFGMPPGMPVPPQIQQMLMQQQQMLMQGQQQPGEFSLIFPSKRS